MSYALLSFLSKIEEIASEAPVYQNGGTGKNGVCDCVGLIMGAMYRLGRKTYDMHSSNYFARYQIEGDLHDVDSLEVGELVFKRRGALDAGYDLHERYLAGGRYDTGDEYDYYHVGVVTNVSPLEITHCTSGTNITRDTKIGKWCCAGRLKGVNYDEKGDDSLTYENGASATVNSAAKGAAWNVRKSPDTDASVLFKVPFNAAITVYETADGWGQIAYNGKRGYLIEDGFTVTGENAEDAVTDHRTLADALAEIDTIKARLDAGGL